MGEGAIQEGDERSADANKAATGRIVVIGSASLFLLIWLVSSAERVFTSAPEELASLIFRCTVDLGITLFLCWGLVKGRNWARTLTLLRSGLGLLAVYVVGTATALTSTIAPSSPFMITTILLVLAVALLLFGPGVRAFFHRELELDQKQRDYVSQVPEPRPGDSEDSSAREEAEVHRAVRALEEALGTIGLEGYYLGEYGGRATRVAELLELIGAHESAETLAEVNRLFGPTGPPADPDARRAAVASLSWSAKSTFARAELELERHGEDCLPLLYAYLRKTRGEFDDSSGWGSEA